MFMMGYYNCKVREVTEEVLRVEDGSFEHLLFLFIPRFCVQGLFYGVLVGESLFCVGLLFF